MGFRVMPVVKAIGDVITDNLARFVIAVIIFIGLVALALFKPPVDDRYFDLAFVIAGFFFGSVVTKSVR